ncbi:MAG: WecB/TagA/CpsF family glycosyltransferase [Chloroflexi bacterium]|nr:WecB/TagA/CpsF family glycosyltransferase [Chloroflexota bacterium]
MNIHGLNLAYTQAWMRDFLNNSDLVFCDGTGVRLGGKILGNYIPPRITYADWMWQLGAFAQENDISFFFLGGKPGIANKAAATLQKRFPDLQIIDVHHGYFDKSAGGSENGHVLRRINNVKPNILVVGFGMPLQEKWLMENWEHIDANIALTGGAVFDYISGDLQRAPKWMTDNGFEWLGRLLIEPQRLWRRYVIGNPLFFWRVMKQKFGLLDIE